MAAGSPVSPGSGTSLRPTGHPRHFLTYDARGPGTGDTGGNGALGDRWRQCRGLPYLTVVDIARVVGTTVALLADEQGDAGALHTVPPMMRKTPRAKKVTLRAKRARRELLVGLGGRIRRYRTARGLTVQDLARALGLSVSYVSLIERAGRNPPYTTVVATARALGTKAEMLVE